MEVHSLSRLVLLHAVILCHTVNGDNQESYPTYDFNTSIAAEWTPDLYGTPYSYYETYSESVLSIVNWRNIKLIPSIHTVVFLVGLPLNIMAIVMFLVKMKVRKPAVVYMLNLATADVLFVSFLPFLIIYRFSGNNWLIGEGMCRLVMAAFYCNMYCSILFMTSISVDRFIAVAYAVSSLSWRTVNRAWLVCGVIWAISLASAVPLLLGEQTMFIPELNITTCYDVQYTEDLRGFYFYYFTTLLSLLFFLPLFITTFCYIRIIHSLSTIKMNNMRKRLRAIYLTVIVLCVFALCFGPTNVLHFSYYLQMYYYDDDSLYEAYTISSTICSISCCLDPLIYYLASSQCQRYVYSLLGRKKDYRPPRRQHSALTDKEEYTEVIFQEETC
ncbi:proteinase-activated receptor 1-like [Lithobates pipiens]